LRTRTFQQVDVVREPREQFDCDRVEPVAAELISDVVRVFAIDLIVHHFVNAVARGVRRAATPLPQRTPV
jgi:hypothetical protein